MASSSSRSQKLQEAQYLKEKGNECFKKKQLDKAVDFYSKAIDCDPNEPVIYANRAQAFLKLKRPESAKVDCDAALLIDATFVKALFRRGVAQVGLGLLDGARKDFEHVMRLDTSNTDALKEIEQLDRTDANRSSVVEFRAVNKPVAIQSQQALRRIPVEVMKDEPKMDTTEALSHNMQQSVIDCQQTKAQKTEAGDNLRRIIPKMPPLPATSYQFMIDHRVLKDHPDVFAEYFMKIHPNSYPVLFGGLMDSDLLTDLVTGLERKIADSSFFDAQLLLKLLALTKVPGFEMAVLFWADRERNALRSVLRSFKEREKDCDSQAMSTICKIFGVVL